MSRHAALPFHLYVNVKNSFLGPDMPDGTTRAIWHGVYGRPYQLLPVHGRALHGPGPNRRH
jgi:hypothetical protein